MEEEKCETCKFSCYNREDKWFYCSNPCNDLVGMPVDTTDGCENWGNKRINQSKTVAN